MAAKCFIAKQLQLHCFENLLVMGNQYKKVVIRLSEKEIIWTAVLVSTISTPFTFLIRMKDAPLRYTAAESCRLPAGVLPRIGWLFHCLVSTQCEQCCFTDRNVPSLWVLRSQGHVQSGHFSNNSMMQLSYTMNLLSRWPGEPGSSLFETTKKGHVNLQYTWRSIYGNGLLMYKHIYNSKKNVML